MINKARQADLIRLFNADLLRVTDEGVVEKRLVWNRWKALKLYAPQRGVTPIIRLVIQGQQQSMTLSAVCWLWKNRRIVGEDLRVFHEDGNPENCAPDNLTLVTHHEGVSTAAARGWERRLGRR